MRNLLIVTTLIFTVVLAQAKETVNNYSDVDTCPHFEYELNSCVRDLRFCHDTSQFKPAWYQEDSVIVGIIITSVIMSFTAGVMLGSHNEDFFSKNKDLVIGGRFGF